MTRYLTARNVILLCTISVTLGFAVVIGYRPELLPPGVTQPVEQMLASVGQRVTILATGGLLALIGLAAAWVWGSPGATGAFAEETVGEPSRDVDVTGASMTKRYEQQQAGTEPFGDPVPASLRDTLVRLYRHNFDEGDAESHVDAGEWTTDRVAAATLTETNAVSFPLWYRLYNWLYPDHAYRYRIRRAVRAVEATCAAELTHFSPPNRARGRLQRIRTLVRTESEADRQ
ncbi:MAG: hypothetical protein J07HN6_01883 [Halonotius sp. J07HN6]|jgi:hypothetical protein|nr:MAG: hypothetical protein J07HN6_01883 [Halonotius sp. J07HN6]